MSADVGRVKSPWHSVQPVDGETLEARTDRLRATGASLGLNRQCSIGWHDECSDPQGDTCRCLCHGPEAQAKAAAFEAHWASQPTVAPPTPDQVKEFARYDYIAGWEAAMDSLRNASEPPATSVVDS
jgi:hypothetical protein